MTIHTTLLANLPQSHLRSLHRQAVKDGDTAAAETIARFMVDRLPETGCLFCNGASYYPVKRGVDFICPRCVVILSNAKKKDLRAGYEKAAQLNMPRKAKAIRKFIEGDINERGETEHQRSTPRISPLRLAGVGSP